MEERPKFRQSLADPETGGLDTFRVIGAMHAPSDERDGWHLAVTRAAGELAVIIRQGVEDEESARPGFVFSPQGQGDLFSVVMHRVAKGVGLERRWMEDVEIARALPAYHGLKDERRFWLAGLRGYCDDRLEERLAVLDRECGTEAGDEFLYRMYRNLLDDAWDMLGSVVFGKGTWELYNALRTPHGEAGMRADLRDALARTGRPL